MPRIMSLVKSRCGRTQMCPNHSLLRMCRLTPHRHAVENKLSHLKVLANSYKIFYRYVLIFLTSCFVCSALCPGKSEFIRHPL